MKDLFKLLQEFREQLQILNRSEKTIKAHLWHLGFFLHFLEDYDLATIQDISTQHIQEYQKYRYTYRNRYNRQDDPRTRNLHLSSIKCFFYYLKRDGFIITNPLEQVPYAKEPKRLPKTALTNTEMKQLLKQPDTKTPIGYRDRTILEVCYSTGIRRLELLNLNVTDVDTEEGHIRINQGKGGKDRIVPMGKIACKYLETYIKGIRPSTANKEDQALFISLKRNRLSKNGLDRIITKYAKQSGIEKHISTHTFRRSCATEMIKNKANLMHVKEILGHSSMETIQKYCNLTIIDLKEAHRKHHPREKDPQ